MPHQFVFTANVWILLSRHDTHGLVWSVGGSHLAIVYPPSFTIITNSSQAKVYIILYVTVGCVLCSITGSVWVSIFFGFAFSYFTKGFSLVLSCVSSWCFSSFEFLYPLNKEINISNIPLLVRPTTMLVLVIHSLTLLFTKVLKVLCKRILCCHLVQLNFVSVICGD